MKSANDKIISNLRSSKYILLVTNILAALCFTVSFFILEDLWFLVAALVLVGASITILIYFGKLEIKYKQILSRPSNSNE
jgi:hypothetical protein